MTRHLTRGLQAAMLFALGAAALPAQEGAVIDQGILVITEGTAEVGQEQFTIRRGRSGDPGGITLTATATSSSGSSRTVTLRLELGSDSEPVAAEIQERNDVRRAVVIAFRPRRITVRSVTPDGESVREHPRRPRTFLSLRAVLSTFAVLPGMTTGDVWAITPSGDPPTTGRLTDHGPDRIRVKGVERSLRHLSLDVGSQTHHLWFDQQNRLIQVSIPIQDLKAVRDNS